MPVIFVRRSTSRRVSLMLFPRRIISMSLFLKCERPWLTPKRRASRFLNLFQGTKSCT
jgi:hypothetical protein